jgi:glycosyltransferase involved in cell wall biosynthesis
MAELVTIGIPCFNAERWIKGTVESALAQTWPEKEVIVVDDGSTDGSREILRGFGEAIQLFYTPHRGSNFARNAILAEAKGTWVQFLDADDALLPEKISTQLAVAEPEDEVLYSPVWIEENGTRASSYIDPKLDVHARWLAWQLPQTGGALWRRPALLRLNGWNEKMPCCQEHELYLRALKQGVRFKHVPTPGALYRIWSEETLCRRDPRLVIEVKTGLIEEMSRWLHGRNSWRATHHYLAGQACFEMARTLAKSDLRAAERYVRERKARNLYHPAGPAAPPAYRICHSLFGFTAAERLAGFLRSARA